MKATKIEYKIKDVYGKACIYIADPKLETVFQTITGQKTLSPIKMAAFEELGIKFERVFLVLCSKRG